MEMAERQDLNTIVTQRANKLLERAREALAETGDTLSMHRLAGLISEDGGGKVQTVQSHFTRLLAGEASWRANDIERFSRVMQRPIEALLSSKAESEVSDKDLATHLFAGINEGNNAEQAREIVTMLRHTLREPDLYHLMWDLCYAAMSARSRGEAMLNVAQVISDSPALDTPGSAESDRQKRIHEARRSRGVANTP